MIIGHGIADTPPPNEFFRQNASCPILGGSQATFPGKNETVKLKSCLDLNFLNHALKMPPAVQSE